MKILLCLIETFSAVKSFKKSACCKVYRKLSAKEESHVRTFSGQSRLDDSALNYAYVDRYVIYRSEF